ncbi:class I SAM-dependent methyltransferase [Synechococcus sp. CCY 0621]|uniref:class I SAM-dependent methyltransferase n=1 Tax=Synechococcus sp. CCY 0621 TaxID=2815603 RepID=UPI001C21B94C|nr:class I SAM-dependent methyltransferase [Synechococcus sp. CCY 0621]
MTVKKEVLELRNRVLSGVLAKIIRNDPELSGDLEPLLAMLGKKEEKDLVLTFTHWLARQGPEIKASLASEKQSGGASQLEILLELILDSMNRINPLEEKVQTRIKVLTEMIQQIIISDYEFSGNLELLLKQLGTDPERNMITTLTRWVFNQNDHTLDLAGKQSGASNTTPLEQHLALLKEDLVVGSAMTEGQIRSTYMSEVFGDMARVRVPLSVIHQETQHMNHIDMVYVCAIPKLREAKKIFEIGTYRGQTTCGFADVCEDAEIYTLNLPPEQDGRYGEYIGSFIKTSPNKHRIHQVFSDSKTFDTTPYRRMMDYVFIDGDHSYEYVKNDTQKAFELLAPNGAIVWHDFAGKSEGVVQYLSELAVERPLMRIKNTCLVLYLDNMDFETYQWKPLLASLEEREYG